MMVMVAHLGGSARAVATMVTLPLLTEVVTFTVLALMSISMLSQSVSLAE